MNFNARGKWTFNSNNAKKKEKNSRIIVKTRLETSRFNTERKRTFNSNSEENRKIIVKTRLETSRFNTERKGTFNSNNKENSKIIYY